MENRIRNEYSTVYVQTPTYTRKYSLLTELLRLVNNHCLKSGSVTVDFAVFYLKIYNLKLK